MSGGQLLLQEFRGVIRGKKQIAVDSIKITVDLFGSNNPANGFNGLRMTVRCPAALRATMNLLNLQVAIIEGIR